MSDGTWHPLFGVPLTMTSNLDDGVTYKAGSQIILGTSKNYAHVTVKRITEEVFGVPFLKYIGAYQPTSDEIKLALLEGVAAEYAGR